MTGKELKTALRSLDWAQAELGRRISVRPNSVSRWIAERDKAIPGPVAAYLHLALQVKRLSMEVIGGR